MRIALCFYGQMRTVELVNNFYSKFNDLTEDIVFDFFISTWDDFDIKTLTIPYKSINYENESTSDCLGFGKSRASKACYHINKVVRLKEEYETENKFAYDAVVLLRTDWALKFSNLVKGCKGIVNLTNNNHTRLAVGITAPPVERDGKLYLTSDGVFIHNNIGANLHANLYNLMYLTRLPEKNGQLTTVNDVQGHVIHGYLISMYSFIALHTPIKGIFLKVNAGEFIDQDDLNNLFLYG